MLNAKNIITQSDTTKICPECSHQLIHPSEENLFISCSGCKTEYPIVGGIPILIPNPLAYLAESTLILKRHLTERESHLSDIDQGIESNVLRRNALKLVKKGIETNLEYIQEILDVLIDATPKEILLDVAIRFNETRTYGFNLKDWRYVRRDWCWLPTSEQQLDIIHSAIANALNKVTDLEKEQSLVLGAGTGRIAVEMAKHFDRVFAIDRSFSMVHFYHKVMNDDFYFYQVTGTNYKTGRDATRIVKASISPPSNDKPDTTLKDLAQNIDFCVGDVMNLALPKHSINTVISAYFTDVLALRLYFDEVFRVLKPNGLFIHFGPFDYPFESITEKLGIDNVKSIFINNGFTILEDRHIFCHHIESSVHQSLFSYNNWFFVARKAEQETQIEDVISPETVLSIKSKIQYKNSGFISDKGTEQDHQTLIINGTEYKGNDTLMIILDLVDGKKSIADILDALSEEFEIDEETKTIFLRKIEEYIQMGILKITPRI